MAAPEDLARSNPARPRDEAAGEAEAARDLRARLLEGYGAPDGVPDEMLDPSGGIRPVWAPFVDAIAQTAPADLAARHARGDQYLADAGVFYRQYGAEGASERDWPLSHMPVIIDEEDWREITAGLTQRADLLELVLADLYGENALVENAHLPASLVAHNREWLRPLVGIKPRGGHFLHFVAFDIGRGPKGNWWVLSDRTQAPSGAGFALENRIATTRTYPEFFQQANIHRLAGFFRTFRDTMLGLRQGERVRVGIYTPGPMNDTYYEHAYIARYLGFQLLEGDDLAVRDGRLLVRTVAGPAPVSVLWRRVDASWADPLELSSGSTLGTPGMLGAVRAGNVTMVNALGSGVLEARAFLAFMPKIAEALLGEPLKIPNIATWWCGQRAERAYVMENAERMMIGDAFETRMVFDTDDALHTDRPARPAPAELAEWIEAHGPGLVGQEAVTLSTTPAFEGDRLVPRPMTVRVFLARTADGWEVMPGGFARIGRSPSPRLAMQEGGSAADVWIVSRGPVENETMLAKPSAPYVREQSSHLPSRAADSFFWLGRYVERAEHTVRLSRAYHIRLAEATGEASGLLELIRTNLATLDSDPADGLANGAALALGSAARAAAAIRDRFSIDGWNALNDLSRTVELMKAEKSESGDAMARALGVLLRKLSGFSGLVHENMYRFTGWRFLSIGRSLERAQGLTALLASFTDPEAPEGALDLAVEVADCAMTYRRRYAVATNRATVVDLLALDPINPRAVIYQLNAIGEHVDNLPGSEIHRQLSPLQRSILETRTRVAISTPETLDTAALLALEQELASMSDLLATQYLF